MLKPCISSNRLEPGMAADHVSVRACIVTFLLIGSCFAASQHECRTYLARSTIPGAGLGMFAGKNFRNREEVTSGDIVVPLIEFPWHTGDNYILWNEYSWSPSGFSGMNSDAEIVSALSGGVGAIPNCFFPLNNADETGSLSDTAGLHRKGDPGSGGFTPYHNRSSSATREIVAGEEIFVSYGESYFETRVQYLGYIPLSVDYKTVNDLLKVFDNSIRSNPFLKVYAAESDIVLDIFTAMVGILSSSPHNLHWITPNTIELLDEVLVSGVEWLHYNRSIREISYLQETGACMDYLRPGSSRIAQAGRGAFASCDLDEGSRVAPLPLIHVDRETLVMYDVLDNVPNGKLVRDVERPIHQQLLLNYCLGHPESDALMCPYGTLTSMINHSPVNANVRLEWNDNLSRHPEWKDMHPDRWIRNASAGLAMDLIATRDIAEGEEILLDYGPLWQLAWGRHVAQWEMPRNSELYMDADVLNEVSFDDILPTMNEPRGYDGESIMMYCRDRYLDVAGLHFLRTLEVDENGEPLFCCRVVSRYERDGEFLYAAEVFAIQEEGDQESARIDAIAFDLPRDAFFFRNMMYSKDYYQSWAFRHEIGLPDHLFPNAWKR